VKKRLYQPTAV